MSDLTILWMGIVTFLLVCFILWIRIKYKQWDKIPKIDTDPDADKVSYTGNPDGTAWGTNKYVH